MRGDVIPSSTRDAFDCILHRSVLERLDLPARVAHEMVMVLATRIGALVTGHPVTQIDPLGEAQLVEALECAVDARDADSRALAAYGVVDLLRRETAVLAPEELDDDPTRSAAASARGTEARKSRVRPLLCHRR